MTDHSKGMFAPHYRPDIDGLRALAVLSVVMFHAFPARLTGGFAGVDVFFVISGFLITKIIQDNLASGRFSVADFYARRIRRIFPSLAIVLASTYAFGWFVLFEDEFAQLGKHLAAGAGFVSNLVLWGEAGYFDTSAETKILLNLWSLGIEEQFYIVWPLLLMAVWRFRLKPVWVIIPLLIASFWYNVSQITENPTASFYSPLSRFWELAAGGLLSYFYRPTDLRARSASQARRTFLVQNAMSVAGLLLIIGSFALFTSTVPFPGYFALAPVAGSVLVLAAGPTALPNRYLLSNPVAVWFGLISYPLYLWHWPLLSYAHILELGQASKELRVALVALAIILAWLCYRFVELPIRRGHFGSLSVPLPLGALAAAGILGFVTFLNNGITDRAVIALNADKARSAAILGDQGYSRHGTCGIADEAVARRLLMCTTDSRGTIRYALVGDSKALSLYPGLVRTAVPEGRWLFMGAAGATDAPLPLISNDPQVADFQPVIRAVVSTLSSNSDIETVVIAVAVRSLFDLNDGVVGNNMASYDHTYLTTLHASPRFDLVQAGLRETLTRLTDADKKVLILVDNPPLPNPGECLARITALSFLNRDSRTNQDCTISFSQFRQQLSGYITILDRMKSDFPGMVEVFDASAIYCDIEKDVCKAEKSGKGLYAYTDHISDYTAGLVGEQLNAFLLEQRSPRSTDKSDLRSSLDGGGH